jgi:YD repeat-containing protein
MRTQIHILILLLITSCSFNTKETKESTVPSYKVISYYNNTVDQKNIFSIKYYDSSDRLIREIGRDEDCTRYIYDGKGRLIETIWGRTCGSGMRQIYIFDSSGNHVGFYKTEDTVHICTDTVKFEQIKFYDSQNRLTAEKVDERHDMEEDTISTWNYYTYGGKIKAAVEIKENEIAIWHGLYHYDTKGRLIELEKVRNNDFEIEYYIYNDSGQLIEKGTKSNGKLITKIGTFKIPNRKRIYDYDSTGFATKETLYQDDKVELRIFNVKTYRK